MSSNQKPSIGILGAGKLGVVLGQLFSQAGYSVMIAGSGEPSKIALSMRVLVPDAEVATKEMVAHKTDVIILALPLGKYTTIPVNELAGKLVIDAMNYWWEIDGDRPDLNAPNVSTSEIVQQYLSKSRVVKAFNHVGYHDLYDHHFAAGNPLRRAVAIAGDDQSDLDLVARLIDSVGFDPYVIGPLSSGKLLQPGNPAFGTSTSLVELKKLLPDSQNN
jgi:8-hydroxy-5-deazaflavin:NADPH oxidoreductase